MDFSELATAESHERGADVEIRHPLTGEKTDVVIKVQGVDSRAWRAHQKKMQRDMLACIADGNMDTAEIEVDALVNVTLGWEGIVKDGKPYPFNKKNCRKLYLDAPHVRDQVDAFIGKRANFTKG